MAEVLITLGIIGIVAALTMPVLIANHNKKVVETRLKKFYSIINQAIKMSEVENGDRIFWYQDAGGLETDENGDPIEGTSVILTWYNKYLSKYLQVVNIETDEGGNPTFYLADGSAFECDNQHDAMRDWVFYPINPKRCINKQKNGINVTGKCAFRFLYCPTCYGKEWTYTGKNFEPYKYNWDNRYESLFNRCKEGDGAFCTALIQYNNWLIPKNYPLRVGN